MQDVHDLGLMRGQAFTRNSWLKFMKIYGVKCLPYCLIWKMTPFSIFHWWERDFRRQKTRHLRAKAQWCPRLSLVPPPGLAPLVSLPYNKASLRVGQVQPVVLLNWVSHAWEPLGSLLTWSTVSGSMNLPAPSICWMFCTDLGRNFFFF